MIVIIDYGSGNLRSIQKSFERYCTDVRISNDLNLIEQAAGLILPGVGSFGDAINELARYNLIKPLRKICKNIPTMGICLGMQLFFSRSEESAGISGLNIIPGEVIELKSNGDVRIPHTGWNRLISTSEPYFLGHAYFNHSYFCSPNEKDIYITYVNHGKFIPAIIIKDLLFGVQFHPEKSKSVGESVIKYFISLLKGVRK
jgi:glutamine amidotransferase